MTTSEIENRVMSERREQPMPPTPGNPALMYTGETRDEFYTRRQALDGLWSAFMSDILGKLEMRA